VNRTNKKKDGLTLVELLVAMLCATLAITMIVGTTLFITHSTDELIDVGSESYHVKSIKDYILSQNYKSNPQSEYVVNGEENTLSHNDTVISRETQILKIEFSDDENFIYCNLVFQDESYRFVAGTKKGG
jgi:hypothetical protein